MADESAETSRLSDELNSDINHNKPANPSYNRGNSADSATNNNKLTVSQVSYSRSDSNHQPPPQIMANGSLIDLDDDDSELEHELQAAGLVEPPDGGYGWIIMMASFMTNCVVDGVVFTAGQGFAQEWERYYGASGTEASLVVSLLSGCYMLAGPIVSALANLFGCRRVAFAGATLAVAGFLLSLIAPNIYVLYFTFGIMGGTGFGMVYLPSIVIVSYYFTSKRALATGIAVCGSGIGMFLFAPIIAYLQEEFNWQQTLLIMTGISCHLFICAALFRPLEPTETQIDKVAEIAMVHEQNRVMSIRSLNKTSLQYSDDVNVVTETETNGAVDMIANLLTTQESKMMPTSNLSTADLFHAASKDAVNVLNRPLSRMDIFYTGSMTSLALRQPPSKPGRRPSLIMLSQASLETFDEQGESSWKDAIIAGIHTMIDISLFKSPVFLVLGSGGFLTMCGFFVPFIFLGRVAQAAGHSSDLSSYLISVLGIVNIFARIFCGWLSDRPQLDSLVIHNTAICLGGLATMAVPFFTGYWMFLVYCVVFGFCTELLGLERLSNSFGLCMLFMGVAALMGAPLAGFLADVTGSYDVSFYVMGFILFLSGLIGFPLRRIAAWERKKMGLEDEEEDEEEEEDNDSEMEPEQKEMYGRAPARSNNNDEEATNRVKERLANLSGEE